jgi:hypothetical protein
MDQNLDRLPLDTSGSIVIHLRLGVVVAGHQLHEKVKRPLSVDYSKILQKKTYQKKTHNRQMSFWLSIS